jgi:hypothetical protein
MAEHLPACDEWRDDLAAWLMAQISPAAEQGLAAHLATCAVCAHEARSLLDVAAIALVADPDEEVGDAIPPSPQLRQRIDATIARERAARWLARAGLAALAGAAAVLVVAMLARGDGSDPVRGRDVVFSLRPPGATASAVVGEDPGGSIVQLTAAGLEPSTTYALWLSPAGGTWEDRVAAGTFITDDRGSADARLACSLPADRMGRVWATTPEGEVALDTE